MKPKLSIIIPCLNEEKNILRLLKSINAQKFKCEIIVADAGSSDKTKKIAKSFGAKVIKGGLPARGRNNGAKAAKSDLLLFLDADVLLKKGFLDYCYNEIQKRKLDAATCYAYPLSKNISDILSYRAANVWIFLFKKIKPYAHGFCIFARKKMHDRIKGFDESLKFGEDSDYVIKANRIGKFDVLKRYIYVSVRRFVKEGRLKSNLRYFYFNIYRLFIGEIRRDVGYKFGHYQKS
jgi:glycosyltransferase involved in cell wall biosynthesis